MTATSPGLACFPDANALTKVAMLSAHLREHRQILQGDVDPLRATTSGRDADREHERKQGLRFEIHVDSL
jgi:hypothetical protein